MSNVMRYDEQDLMACKTSGLFREDAGESVFFAQELQKVKAKTYDVKTPANNAMSIFPVTSEADPGADTVAFDSYDSVGMAKIITNYADDLPRADRNKKLPDYNKVAYRNPWYVNTVFLCYLRRRVKWTIRMNKFRF